jgi:retinol dehydrogenase-14
MTGKTVLVTGASRGIGKAAAVGLAKLGATVGIVARDATRGATAADDIAAISGNRSLQLFLADLSVQAEVRRLANEVRERFDRLDVLINNAGAINMTRTVTVDGIETTFAVNHLAYFLLTTLLLPLLEASGPSRIVNVSSAAAKGAAIDFDDLQGERRYGGWRAYGQSKLANILFTEELARRLQGTGVTANCLHPGVIKSGFGKNDRGLTRLGLTLAGPFLDSPEKGAETMIYLASSSEVEGVTGKYFYRCRETQAPPASHDRLLATSLWEVSEKLTGVMF